MYCTISPTYLIGIGAAITTPFILSTVGYALIQTDPKIFLLVSIENSSTLPLPTDKTDNQTPIQYSCKYKSKLDKACFIDPQPIDSTKKWTNLSQLNAEPKPQLTPTTSTSSADKFYRVSISQEMSEAIDLNSTDTLELSLPSTTSTTKTATLKPLFLFNSKSSQTKNNLFLVKAHKLFSDGSTEAESASVTTSTTYNCAFNDSDILLPTKHKPCSIYSFESTSPSTAASETSTYQDLTFSGSKTAVSDSLNKYRYYLLEFTNPPTPQDLLWKKIIYVAQSTTGTTPSHTKIAEFSPILPAVLTGTNGSHHLFILS